MRACRRTGRLAVAVCLACSLPTALVADPVAGTTDPVPLSTDPVAKPSDPIAAPASPFAASFVVLGVGAGAMHVDFADPDTPGESFGTQPRVAFSLGLEARPWLEIGSELGFTFLPESDSLNAVLAAQGSSQRALRTHVQASLDMRARWLHGVARWAPFARVGFGVASLFTDAQDVVRENTTRFAWNAGGGMDIYAHRHVLLRFEGLYLGQGSSSHAASHAIVTLGVHYALDRHQLGIAP